MQKANEQRPGGIRWNIAERLEDIDCLISHKIGDLKKKISDLIEEGKKVGLSINEGKTKEMRIKNANAINN